MKVAAAASAAPTLPCLFRSEDRELPDPAYEKKNPGFSAGVLFEVLSVEFDSVADVW